MLKRNFKRIVRPATAAEKKRLAEIIEKVMQEYPGVTKGTIGRLARFWDTHDFTDFEDQFERVEGPLFELNLKENERGLKRKG